MRESLKWKGTCTDLSNTLRMHRNCRSPEQYYKRPCPEQYYKRPSLRTRHFNFREARTGNGANGNSSVSQTGRVIVKLLNRKDTQNVLKEKHKLRSINLFDDNTDTKNKRKIFINESLFSYQTKVYGTVKDLNNEGLIDYFWITNETIKIREPSQSKPISIIHETEKN